MSTISDRLKIAKAELSDSANVPQYTNAIVDVVDGAMAAYSSGTLANRPISTPGQPGMNGRFYLATDVQRIYVDTGTGWVQFNAAVPSVGSLPASPVDGDEVYLSVGSALWHLRYNAAAPSGKRWESVGGPALARLGLSAQPMPYLVFGVAAGSNIAVPVAGTYRVKWGATFSQDSGGESISRWLRVNVGSVGLAGTDRDTSTGAGSWYRPNIIAEKDLDLTAATYSLASRDGGGASSFADGYLIIEPIAIGG